MGDKKEKKQKKRDSMAEEETADFTIKPSKDKPKVDTSDWPLLLKNYDKLNVRTNHYTPIPKGYTPHQRPLDEY